MEPCGRSLQPGWAWHQSVATSNLSSLSLQEAQQSPQVSKLSPKEIQKNYEHLFKANDVSVGGSYLWSKVAWAEELRIQAQEDREKEQMPNTWPLSSSYYTLPTPSDLQFDK